MFVEKALIYNQNPLITASPACSRLAAAHPEPFSCPAPAASRHFKLLHPTCRTLTPTGASDEQHGLMQPLRHPLWDLGNLTTAGDPDCDARGDHRPNRRHSLRRPLRGTPVGRSATASGSDVVALWTRHFPPLPFAGRAAIHRRVAPAEYLR